MMIEKIIPIIIHENVPSVFRIEKGKFYGKREIKFTLQIQNFIDHFKEVIIAPSSEEAILIMSKRGLFTVPHFFFIFSENEGFIESQVSIIRKNASSVLSPVFVSSNVIVR
jgi:hypothetical protein